MGLESGSIDLNLVLCPLDHNASAAAKYRFVKYSSNITYHVIRIFEERDLLPLAAEWLIIMHHQEIDEKACGRLTFKGLCRQKLRWGCAQRFKLELKIKSYNDVKF